MWLDEVNLDNCVPLFIIRQFISLEMKEAHLCLFTEDSLA